MRRRLRVIFVGFAVLALVLPACSNNTETQSSDEPYKVAFIYVIPVGDSGWTHEHDRGRIMLESELRTLVKTTYVENVAEGPEAGQVFRKVVQEGYDMIFATSPGYMDDVFQVAQEFPDVKFEQCAGSRTNNNLATYNGRIYQPRYLSGIVAGKMTTNDNIGYVAAFPDPEVIQGINAFTLGVRSVNPSASVTVIWTETWYDPEKEREAAVTLLDGGADIIAQHQDSIEPQKAAQERGMLSIGYNSDMRTVVGDTVLTGPVWHWDSYYIATVRNAINGTWQTHRYWGGMKDGVVGLADFSPKVPQDVRILVETARQRILAGRDVFCSPIRDQNGAEVVAAGYCLSDDEIVNMHFFVEGVVGTIPED